MWRLTVAVLVLVLAAACGDPIVLQGATPTPTEPTPGGESAHPDAVWFDVLAVSQQGGEIGEVYLIEQDLDLDAAWGRYAFDGEPPEVDFSQQVVVAVTRPEDACPDEVVEARLSAGVLEPVFMPPPGGCEQPLIATAYAIAFHRADLGTRVTLRISEHEAFGDIEEQLDLHPYDGPPAPPPPIAPQQMTQAELAEVFAGHPLRPCSELPDLREEHFGDWPQDGGFTPPPMDFDVPEDVQGPYAAEHADTFGWFAVDQPAGEWIVGVTADLEGHERRLAERHPGESFRVVETPHTQADLAAAQEAVMPLHEGDPPRILGSGYFAYLELSVADPTREHLDAIAELVDPALACVDPVLSGLPADAADDTGGDRR